MRFLPLFNERKLNSFVCSPPPPPGPPQNGTNTGQTGNQPTPDPNQGNANDGQDPPA